jgi:hypothetical protein
MDKWAKKRLIGVNKRQLTHLYPVEKQPIYHISVLDDLTAILIINGPYAVIYLFCFCLFDYHARLN